MTKGSDASTDVTLGAAEPSAAVPAVEAVVARRYRIIREIGRGGMGAVFLAHDARLGEHVALKVLLDSTASARSVEQLQREVKLSRRVTHRNVARVFDIGEFGDGQFLTMEFIEGESLATRLARDTRLPLGQALDVAVQICRGLAAAHDAGVIHRDLKPGNILIDRDGRAAITDFGIARSVEADAAKGATANKLVGTPAFMAPEQVQGRQVTAAADIYALGLVLYRMLTGRHAFEADSPAAVAVARVDRPPVDPRTHDPDLPTEVADVILNCLSREPRERPDDSRLVAEALIRCASTTLQPLEPGLDLSPSGEALRPFAPIEPGSVGLAILPFRYQGPPEQQYVADALTEDLIDVLSVTHGLQVCSRSATDPFAERRDPKIVAQALGVDKVVDGTVRPAGDQLRISVRVIDGDTGFQAYTGQFQIDTHDLLKMQDEIAQRIAETLRVELEQRAHAGNVSPELLERYLRARGTALKSRFTAAVRTIELLEPVVQQAPGFKLGPPHLASAYIQAWAMPGIHKDGEYGSLARAMVKRAMEVAPDVAVTHYVVARLAVSEGRYADAARSLAEALRIAPTYANAHDYLGMLQLECDRPTEGRRRVEFCNRLDPELEFGTVALARHFALHDDDEAFEQLAKSALQPHPAFMMALIRVRRAAWRRQFDEVNALCEQIKAIPGGPADAFGFFQHAVTGGDLPDDIATHVSQLVGTNVSPRGWTFALQLTAEVLAIRGEDDQALSLIAEAVDGVLTDADWMRRCAALQRLRSHPDFAALQQRVQRRAAAVWMVA